MLVVAHNPDSFPMRFDFLSIFPEAFESYFKVSILKRAQEDGKVLVRTWNIRDYAHDKHKTTDDTPYGGGAGMVMKPEPIFECAEQALGEGNVSRDRTRIILLSAKGMPFTQQGAKRLSGYDRLVFICGRYEGVDERVAEHLADEEISIGSYVLTGGELPAMVISDAVARLLPGVLGNAESAETESFSDPELLEHPHYTKPEEYRGWRVPEVLLSGNHAAISKWREDESGSVDGSMKKSEE